MSEAKTCTRCGETKPIESFTRYKYKGEYKRKTVCAECLEKSNKIPAGMFQLFAHVPEHVIYGG